MHYGCNAQNAAEAMEPKRFRLGQWNFITFVLLGFAVAVASGSGTRQRQQRSVEQVVPENVTKSEATEEQSNSGSTEYQEDYNSYEQAIETDESMEAQRRAEPNVSATMNEQTQQSAEAAAQTISDDSDDDDLDGRSAAFVHNQYIQDPPFEPLPEESPPLYQLLQQQMEQVLASSAPEFALYNNVNTNVGPKEETLPNKPIFGYGNNGDYGADEASDSSQYISELPIPIATKRPKSQNALANVPPKRVSPAAAIEPTDKHKRRITFRTVSTASHFVATPLADLMFKFSIGIAKPPAPNQQLIPESSDGKPAETAASTVPNEGAYTADKPKRRRPVTQADAPKKVMHSKNK